jgi:hypothetical protein
MRPLSDHSPPTPLSQEQFMRLFLQSEREILRYVMAIVPNVADARDILQETALALWKANDKYDPARPGWPYQSLPRSIPALFCRPKAGIEEELFPSLPSSAR